MFGLASPSARNNSALPTKYTEILHTRKDSLIHSFIHSSLSIIIMQIRFQKPRDHLYVAHLMTLISSSAVQHRETERLLNSEWEGSERFGRELI